MDIIIDNHPSDDIIELYALGRLSEELVPPFEEHLLVCARCQDALQSEDMFFQSITHSDSSI